MNYELLVARWSIGCLEIRAVQNLPRDFCEYYCFTIITHRSRCEIWLQIQICNFCTDRIFLFLTSSVCSQLNYFVLFKMTWILKCVFKNSTQTVVQPSRAEGECIVGKCVWKEKLAFLSMQIEVPSVYKGLHIIPLHLHSAFNYTGLLSGNLF